MPKVSVIIPTYNCAKYVTEAIESVLAQTYKDYEIIVIDDGSTDNTKEALASYIEKGLIRYVWQENKGVSAARNRGLEEAKGEYIAFLDADDVWLPEFLEKMCDSYSILSICDVRIVYVDEERSRYEDTWSGFSFCDLLRQYRQLIATPGRFLFSRTLIVKSGIRWNERFRIREDWDFLFSIFSLGIDSIKYVDKCLFQYRIRKNGVTHSNSDLWVDYDLLLLLKWRNKFRECNIFSDYAYYMWDLASRYWHQRRDIYKVIICVFESVSSNPNVILQFVGRKFGKKSHGS